MASHFLNHFREAHTLLEKVLADADFAGKAEEAGCKISVAETPDITTKLIFSSQRISSIRSA